MFSAIIDLSLIYSFIVETDITCTSRFHSAAAD